MLRILAIVCLLLMQICFLQANDGSFYARGEHLIPMQETEISLKKEILDIKKVGNVIYVSVYYVFFQLVTEKKQESHNRFGDYRS